MLFAFLYNAQINICLWILICGLYFFRISEFLCFKIFEFLNFCIVEDYVTKFCNLELEIPEGGGTNAQGFIMSPGYPKFYIGQSECRWRITAPSPQRVEITVLDISLSGTAWANAHFRKTDFPRFPANYGRRPDGYCEDELSIYVDDLVLVNTCSEHEQPPVVISENNVIEVKVVGRSGSLVTKRGILIYYRGNCIFLYFLYFLYFLLLTWWCFFSFRLSDFSSSNWWILNSSEYKCCRIYVLCWLCFSWYFRTDKNFEVYS